MSDAPAVAKTRIRVFAGESKLRWRPRVLRRVAADLVSRSAFSERSVCEYKCGRNICERVARSEFAVVDVSLVAIGAKFCDSGVLSANSLRGLYNPSHARPMAGRRHYVQGPGLKMPCRCVRRL